MAVKALLILSCSLFTVLVQAQLILGIAAEPTTKAAPNFTISKVIDSTASNIIGKVYLADKKRTMPVRLSMSLDKYFSRLAWQSQTHSHLNDTIILVINELLLRESESEAILKGSLWLTISYFKKHQGRDIFLLKKTTNLAYKRTFGSATPTSFEKLVASAFNKNIDFFTSWKTLNQAYHPAFVSKSQIVIHAPYQINVDDTVYYESRSITWADFRGDPAKQGGRFAAAIFPNIAFDLEMEIKNQTLKAHFTPKVYMVQGMSWVKSIALNNYSLEHEQLHFDIAKIAMNNMVKRVAQIEAKTPDDLQSQIQYEYIEAYREMNRLQSAYDEETEHGVNRLTQSFWKTQISQWLKE